MAPTLRRITQIWDSTMDSREQRVIMKPEYSTILVLKLKISFVLFEITLSFVSLLLTLADEYMTEEHKEKQTNQTNK